MEIEIKISRKDKCNAYAIYSENGVCVSVGSQINIHPSSSARGKLVKEYRNDRNFVSADGILIQECKFSSVSAAARFVTGGSENGYNAWKVNDETTLGMWLERNGMRKIKSRIRKEI